MSRLKAAVGAMMLVGLLGCQKPQPSYDVERSRSYQQSTTEVWNKILQFLQADDITVRRSDPANGTVEAERKNYQDAGWAECELAIGTDRSSDTSRPRRAPAHRSKPVAFDHRQRGGWCHRRGTHCEVYRAPGPPLAESAI
jgi:hypothetical protein